MAVSFGNKPTQQTKASQPKAETKAQSPSKAVWYKRGVAAAEEIKHEDQKQQESWEQSQRLFRFRIKENEEARITFVDANLNDEGLLDVIVFREHHLLIAGKWGNYYTCTASQEPCPICEAGDDPSLVSAMTVIDHRSYETKSGIKVPHSKKLFVCKRNTHKLLQTLAAKRDGLAGCTFDVMRSGENAAAVGSNFDFVQKDDIDELKEHFSFSDDKGKKMTLFLPADYEQEIPYYTADELRQKGFGKSTPIGSEKPLVESSKPASGKFANEL